MKAFKCDLHIHSNFSDGNLSINEIVDFYGKKGFGAIAITDHLCERQNLIGRFSHTMNYSLSEATFTRYVQELEAQRQRAWDQYQMILIPGYEITKNSLINHRSAHILVLGTTQYIKPENSVDQILAEAKQLGAFTIAAHPFHTGEFEFQTFHLWSRKSELWDKIDAWEMNSRKKISSEVLNSGLPVIANSDFHHYGHYSSWKTKLYAEKSKEGIFDAIRNQRLDFYLDA